MISHRILLVAPPFYRLFKDTYALPRFPLSLGYLAAAIRARTDWTVQVFNADFTTPYETFDAAYLAGEGAARYRRNLDDPSAAPWRQGRSRCRAP